MTTITEKAWALIPGYTHAKTILDTLVIKRVLNGVSPFTASFEEGFARAAAEATVEDLLAAGKPVPDDVAAPVIEARERDALAVARTQAMNRIAMKHGTPKALVTKDSVGEAFVYLRSELDRILDAAVALGPDLDGANTAGEAIRTPGPAKAWKKLTALADEYDETRGVQFELTRVVVPDETGDVLLRPIYDAVALFADALDVHPHWLRLRNENSPLAETGRAVEAYSEWMTQQQGTPWSLTGERELDLIRLATETTPWLPTPDQFLTARNAAETAVQRPSGRFIDRQEDARAAYYRTTGAQPIGQLTTSERITTSSKQFGVLGTGDRYIA